MFDEINGLPAHPLLIHALVVLVPLVAAMLVAGMVWPRVRARLGVVTPALALVTLILVPVTVQAGRWLQTRIDPGHQNNAINQHVQRGQQLLPWVAGLFVLAALVWILDRKFVLSLRPERRDALSQREARGGIAVQPRLATRRALPGWVAPVLTLLCAAVAVGTVVMLFRAGDTGARAAWDYVGRLPGG